MRTRLRNNKEKIDTKLKIYIRICYMCTIRQTIRNIIDSQNVIAVTDEFKRIETRLMQFLYTFESFNTDSDSN